jgi:hypothetical protein
MQSQLNEERLFRAVIAQALTDAINTPPASAGYSLRNEHQRAREWFKDAGKAFQMVCMCAGLEPSQVQRSALKQIEEANAKAGRGDRINILGIKSDRTLSSAQDRT